MIFFMLTITTLALISADMAWLALVINVAMMVMALTANRR